jgi:hypothetical protein
VDRFFFIDNASTDGSSEFLISKEKTHVLKTKRSYNKAHSGMDWVKVLLDGYGRDHWCLKVDADEYLCYPYLENVSIKDLCDILDEEGCNAFEAILLDMYSNKPIRATVYRKGEDPLLAASFFDKYFYNGPLSRMSWLDIDKGKYAGGARSRIFNMTPYLRKFPLFKFCEKMNIFSGCHRIDGAAISQMRGCLMHFKYFTNFVPQVFREVFRREHWKNALEYRIYAKKLIFNPNISFYFPETERFQSSFDLLKTGIIRSSNKLDKKWFNPARPEP